MITNPTIFYVISVEFESLNSFFQKNWEFKEKH